VPVDQNARMPKHRAVAPVFDLIEVLWPIVVGWAVIALLTGLYTRTGAGMWAALVVTLFGGIAVTQVIRYTVQDRPWIGIFTAVAIGFIGLTTFGWRAVALLVRRWRPAAA
jgi:hypothetical protein